MEQNITPGSRTETGGASIQEQGLIRNLALDVQEIAGIYKRERGAGRDGTDIPLMFIADDISQLKELGVLEKYKESLKKIGADPIIRFAVLSQLNRADQSYGQTREPYALENIRMHIELGETLGLDQPAGNPDYEGAAELFRNYQNKHQASVEAVEQPAPVIESPKKEPTPEEVSGLVAQLRETMNPKEEDDYSERVRKRDMAEELEKGLGELLNLPPEVSFAALEKSEKDFKRASNLSQTMIYFILDSPIDREKIPSIESLFSQISPEVLESYKLYVQAKEKSWENKDSDPDLRKEIADELNKQQSSLITKLRETAGDESGEIWGTDIYGPAREWKTVIEEENPDIDKLRQALINRNHAVITYNQEYTPEYQKLIDLLNNAAAKAGLKFMEGESGYLELIESTKPAQVPKGPGVLGRLAKVFKRGGKETDPQAKQIIKDLEEADDETILHYYGLMDKLDDIAFKEILEKGIELAPQFKNGLKPGNLGKLTEFSEYVTEIMEEKGILDPSEHEDNIENIRPTLWNMIKMELQTSK